MATTVETDPISLSTTIRLPTYQLSVNTIRGAANRRSGTAGQDILVLPPLSRLITAIWSYSLSGHEILHPLG